MSDPLSVAAGVGGLIALGIQTTEYLVNFYTAYRDRDRDLAMISDLLNGLLQSLHLIAREVHRQRPQAVDDHTRSHIDTSIISCQSMIKELEGVSQKLKDEPSHSIAEGLRTSGRRVAYPFRQSTIYKLREEVGEFRDNLSLALNTLQIQEGRDIQNGIEEIKAVVTCIQAHDLTADVRNWLKAPDATIEYNIACAKRHVGTGLWLVKSPAFESWLVQDNSFLWLSGFAGCGKSVLHSTAVQHAFRHQRTHGAGAIGFFSFTYSDKSKQDTSAMLRALLLQLTGQIDGVDQELARLKESYNQGTPPVPTLMAHLRQAILRTQGVYILLDALDECPKGDARDQALSAINDLRGWSLPGMHILITSRDYPDIRDQLEADPEQVILMKNDSINADIEAYISSQLERDPRLRQRSDNDRNKIKSYLAKNDHGV